MTVEKAPICRGFEDTSGKYNNPDKYDQRNSDHTYYTTVKDSTVVKHIEDYLN